MARSVRNGQIDTRTSRLKLEKGDRIYAVVADGAALGYLRTKNGNGTWSCRMRHNGSYSYRAIGDADDYQDANGVDILDFFQAQEAARKLVKELKTNKGILAKPLTVADAADLYLAWYKEHKKAFKETEHTVKAHIRPALGDKLASELTAKDIRAWHNKLATTPPRRRTKMGKKQRFGEKPETDDGKRARKSTANRILTVLKAILNKAFQDEHLRDDTPWRKVKPFPNADEPITRFLTHAEAVRLINASRPDFRLLVKSALFTGARYGELTRLKAANVNLDTGLVYITAEAKSGKGRHIPLHDDALDFFKSTAAGKRGNELVFTKQDGTEWGKNHHVRLLQAACENAKIDPPIGFHELRHTYASTLAQLGVDLLTISKLLGHADTRITSRHYAHLADKTLSDAVKKLPSFGHVPNKNVSSINEAKAKRKTIA
jgi:integrase